MIWVGYESKDQAIKNARFTEDSVWNHILAYVKTIESEPPHDFDLQLSIHDKDQLWNQVLPEVHFYSAGRTQYR